MIYKNDKQRKAIFANMQGAQVHKPKPKTKPIAGVHIKPISTHPESEPGIQDEEEREPEISQRLRTVLDAMDRAKLEQKQQKALLQKGGVVASGFQSGFQAASPQPSAPAPAPPQEEFVIPTGGIEEKYPYLMPFKELIPEVADVARGGGQAAKGAIVGGALATGIGMASGMARPWRFGALGAVGGALPGALSGARELTDIPAAAFDAGKEAVRIGLAQASPILQTAGQLVQLGTLKVGDIVLSPYTYGPSIHDTPYSMEYPPYYAKLPKVVDISGKEEKKSKEGFTDDEIDAIKSSLSQEFGYLKASETQVNQYTPEGYKTVARAQNKDQPIEAESSSAFYDPRADKLHVAIFGNKTQSLRSLVHDLAHSMGHFKDDPGLNEGMAEFMAVKIMKQMGIPKEKAEEQVGYKKEYGQVKGLVSRHGEDAVKQVFMCTHDSSDLATNMMFDERIHRSGLSDVKPKSSPIIDFKGTAKENKRPNLQGRFKEATFNIDGNTSNSGV